MTRRHYEPRAFAPVALQHFREHRRCALWAKPGMGKTVITATFLDHLHNVWGEDRPTLIAAPLRVAQTVWPEEPAKWDHLSGLDIVSVTGTEAERVAALKRDRPVFAINYENIEWLCKHLGERWPFGTVVPDEATKLKNFRLRQGGKRAQSLARYAHTHVANWINLTGTPSPTGCATCGGRPGSSTPASAWAPASARSRSATSPGAA